MPFACQSEIKYYQFDLFKLPGVVHGIFTRHGGVSPAPWDSLNVGGLIGDARSNVVENRHRMFAVLGRQVETLFDVWQVHSADVICTNAPRGLDQPHIKGDAILTDRASITLFMRFADCVPILLYDPTRKVAGMVHAGWQGTVKKVAGAAVRKMQEVYGSSPQDILAGIGPSISADHYEVKEDVIGQVRAVFEADAERVLVSCNGKTAFDLKRANQLVLEESGVQQIEISDICTACHTEDWFSHRGDGGKTGRFGVLLAIDG